MHAHRNSRGVAEHGNDKLSAILVIPGDYNV